MMTLQLFLVLSAFPNIEIAYTLSSACKLSHRLAC